MDVANSLVVVHHVIYLSLAISVTMIVGQILFRNGKVFLDEAFPKNERLAESINHLLLVGFYLINIGWLGFTLRTGLITTTEQLIEAVSKEMGGVLITLGVMHFINMYVFNVFRRKALDSGPVSPSEYFPLRES